MDIVLQDLQKLPTVFSSELGYALALGYFFKDEAWQSSAVI